MSYDPNDPLRKLAGWGLWYLYWRIFRVIFVLMCFLFVVSFFVLMHYNPDFAAWVHEYIPQRPPRPAFAPDR